MRGLYFVVLLVGLASARCVTKRVKENIRPPHQWKSVGLAPADHPIALRIGLPQPKFAQLEKDLYEVSNPRHERYGKHLSKEEAERLVAPHTDSIDAVNTWLAEHGIKDSDCERSPAQDWITIRVPVSVAEKMLDTVSRLQQLMVIHLRYAH